MINPDDLLGNCKLAHFADWFLKSGGIKDVDAPSDKNTLLFIEGVHGITLYKKKPFQVQLFICQPNLNIPVHTHPNVDSYEVFLYGMSFKKCGVAQEESLEKVNAQPIFLNILLVPLPNSKAWKDEKLNNKENRL